MVSIHGMCNKPHEDDEERLTCEVLNSFKLFLSAVVRGRNVTTYDFWYMVTHARDITILPKGSIPTCFVICPSCNDQGVSFRTMTAGGTTTGQDIMALGQL